MTREVAIDDQGWQLLKPNAVARTLQKDVTERQRRSMVTRKKGAWERVKPSFRQI